MDSIPRRLTTEQIDQVLGDGLCFSLPTAEFDGNNEDEDLLQPIGEDDVVHEKDSYLIDSGGM